MPRRTWRTFFFGKPDPGGSENVVGALEIFALISSCYIPTFFVGYWAGLVLASLIFLAIAWCETQFAHGSQQWYLTYTTVRFGEFVMMIAFVVILIFGAVAIFYPASLPWNIGFLIPRTAMK